MLQINKTEPSYLVSDRAPRVGEKVGNFFQKIGFPLEWLGKIQNIKNCVNICGKEKTPNCFSWHRFGEILKLLKLLHLTLSKAYSIIQKYSEYNK